MLVLNALNSTYKSRAFQKWLYICHILILQEVTTLFLKIVFSIFHFFFCKYFVRQTRALGYTRSRATARLRFVFFPHF